MSTVSSIPKLEKFVTGAREKAIHTFIERGKKKFVSLAKSHMLFHGCFWVLISLEFLSFAVFASSMTGSLIIAVPLAATVLTVFVYAVLAVSFQNRKIEQFWRLKRSFIEKCASTVQSLGYSEYHLMLASSALKFAEALNQTESRFYTTKKSSLLVKVGCLLHWRDVLRMREVLVLSAIDHYTQLVQKYPTDIELHTHLAGTFIILARLYKEPTERAERGDIHLTKQSRFAAYLESKELLASDSAIQEYKILQTFAPNDPWVYAQLAVCYRHLSMLDEEISAYEKIMELCPKDNESLFRLGLLYFKSNQHAKALKVYEQLKAIQFSRADELLAHYNHSLRKILANSFDLRV